MSAVARRSGVGVLAAESARRRLGGVEQGHAQRAHPADRATPGRVGIRGTRCRLPRLSAQDRALRLRRHAVRLVHQGNRRAHQHRFVVVGADRLPEGRVLHDAGRSRRTRLQLRSARRTVLPAPRVEPVLVAAWHDSVAAVAEPGAADRRYQPNSARCSALRCAARTSGAGLGLRRNGPNSRPRHRARRPSRLADHLGAGGRRRARAARQGRLPGHPRRGLCTVGAGLPVHGSRRRRRREGRLPGDLDGRGDVETQPALPVRDRIDDVEQSDRAARSREAQRSSNGSRTTFVRARWPGSGHTSPPQSRCWCRWCCSSPTAAGRRPSRHS